MVAIRSNKALKYNPIRPDQEGIIELKIVDVREFLESELFVISIQDSIIVESEGVESATVLTTRSKQFTFTELDALEASLQPQPGETYMEQRLNLLKAGLLFITQNDPFPVYFSEAADWEAV